MNEFEQRLFLAGAEGELRTAGLLTETMNREAMDEIITFATADFMGYAAREGMEFPSAVDCIMSFRAYLAGGKFALAVKKAPIIAVDMSIAMPSGGATITFQARASMPEDMSLAETYISLYDQISEAYKSFRDKRRVGSPQSTGGNTQQNGSNPTSEIIDVTALRVEDRNGKRYVRAVGGRWTKFGVAAWPEVLEQLPVPAANLIPGDNPIRIKAELSLGSDGKPEKVTRFFN